MVCLCVYSLYTHTYITYVVHYEIASVPSLPSLLPPLSHLILGGGSVAYVCHGEVRSVRQLVTPSSPPSVERLLIISPSVAAPCPSPLHVRYYSSSSLSQFASLCLCLPVSSPTSRFLRSVGSVLVFVFLSVSAGRESVPLRIFSLDRFREPSLE